MSDVDRGVTGRQIRHFWTPLVLTSLLMTLSGPLLNVAIGRASDPTLEFAGFWVAFTVMLFIQSASLALQQVTVALGDSGETLRRLAVSGLLLGLAASLTILAVALTPLGGFVFQVLIPTSARVGDLARTVLAHLAPVPILIAVRDLATGVAIRERRTTLVAVSSMVRVVVLAAVVGAVVMIGPGARAAATAFVIGIAVESAWIIAATHPCWGSRLRVRTDFARGVSYLGILRVATPLAVATLVWTAVRPVVSAILGRLPDSELAQASFGVVLPILLVTCSPLWGFHNVSLVLPKDRNDLRRVIASAAGITILFALGIGLVTLTPLKLLVLRLGFDLSPEMERVVAPALGWLTLAPFFLTARALAQGLLMKSGRTGVMLIVSPIKLVLMVVIGLAAVTRIPPPDGAALAILLVMGGDLLDALILGLLVRRLIARGLLFREPSRPAAEPEGSATQMPWALPPPSLEHNG